MTNESLGSRIAIGLNAIANGVEECDFTSVRLANGRKICILSVDAKHELLLREAMKDLLSFRKGENERRMNELRAEWKRKLEGGE